jgi:hypothetical protein
MKTSPERRHILLQHRRTRMFYIRNGDWTSDPARARDFVSTQAAGLYARARGMSDIQAVVHFHRPDLHDLVLPLNYDEPAQIFAVA